MREPATYEGGLSIALVPLVSHFGRRENLTREGDPMSEPKEIPTVTAAAPAAADAAGPVLLSDYLHTHPQQVGPYRIVALLGEGGMGSVYRAEQRSPIKRVVAIKVIKSGYDTKEVIARFESERQALARMDHPHIARVLEAGATVDTVRPYFVMEYVPGVPLPRFCDENKLSLPERLELFRRAKMITAAYAPYKNTVHRISTDMLHPWVLGFRRPLFWQEWWHMVDIDPGRPAAK